MELAARDLHAMGAANVLIKGGHLTGHLSTDILFDGRRVSSPSAPSGLHQQHPRHRLQLCFGDLPPCWLRESRS